MRAFHAQRMLHKTPQARRQPARTPGSFQKTPGTTPSGYDLEDSFITKSAPLLPDMACEPASVGRPASGGDARPAIAADDMKSRIRLLK